MSGDVPVLCWCLCGRSSFVSTTVQDNAIQISELTTMLGSFSQYVTKM
jgi:hypothetical protein